VEAQASRWAELYGWDPPELSRAKDYIREIKKARTWLDDPWHLGIFAAHEAPELEPSPDAIPDVRAVAVRVFAGGKRLTARQGRWVARLRGLLKPILTGGDARVDDAYAAAVVYAARERAAAALALATGMREPPIPQGHESETWALDVFFAATERGSGLTWAAYAAAKEAGLVEGMSWPAEGLELRPESTSVVPLYNLLLDATPDLTDGWRQMSSALLLLRARAESGFTFRDSPRVRKVGEADWESLCEEERLQVAKGIGDDVLEWYAWREKRKERRDGQ